jgi:hypothetical protein
VSTLVEVVAAVDPALAPYAVDDPASGRFAEVEGVRGFVLEAVYEGYLMHYGKPRAFTGMDADLRLLAGDALYALGLSRLAETGDLEAVAVLSDLISDSAQAHAEERAANAEALWEASSDRLRVAQAAGGARGAATSSGSCAP